MKLNQLLSLSFAIISLMILSQCEWPNGCCRMEREEHEEAAPSALPASRMGADSSEVLATVDGNPLITAHNLSGYVDDIVEAQPQYKQVLQIMPEAEKQIFDGMLNERLITLEIKEKGIDKTPEYQKDRAKMQEFIDRSLAIKYFQKEHPVTVSKVEIKRFYEENKNSMPELMMSPAGVKAEAVIFDNKQEAQTFYNKVRNTKVDFAKAAGEANLTVKDLGIVNDQSFDVDTPIREKLATMKKTPAVEMIDLGDGKTAVVKATGKQEAKYVPFEQVEAGLENFLKNQKSVEVLTKEIDKLKKRYKVNVNTEYFERKKKSAQPTTEQAASGEMPKALTQGA